jgi:hypothetical protein
VVFRIGAYVSGLGMWTQSNHTVPKVQQHATHTHAGVPHYILPYIGRHYTAGTEGFYGILGTEHSLSWPSDSVP